VVTIVTPASISCVNRRLMIMASAELLTTISSKARQRTSRPGLAATGGIGSPALLHALDRAAGRAPRA
jgi:hypothetical protein